ncbi:hypothetical protein [Flavihumibacter petaseus]|uniref:Uncharacterized protein n=1 Tax=Flavihumibacter petaseus NBRC 106054 TaxID=1220578 RepID=A0A0E9N321_9BACT|nr:hypothetical protein [Flavihumibacter petaseus]GAO43755.1 hypothetical protein FPE01S_02_08610 [Flavihumibacter petaseus NBRC 106054]
MTYAINISPYLVGQPKHAVLAEVDHVFGKAMDIKIPLDYIDCLADPVKLREDAHAAAMNNYAELKVRDMLASIEGGNVIADIIRMAAADQRYSTELVFSTVADMARDNYPVTEQIIGSETLKQVLSWNSKTTCTPC